MNKGDGWYSGASNIPDTASNLVFQEQKSRIPITYSQSLPVKGTIPLNSGNGIILTDSASTDLHLVADDLTAGSNWASRSGGFTASKVGTNPTVGLESGLYPAGGWAGTGYRTAVSGFGSGAYYKFSYNAAHSLTSSSTVTYEMLLRLGVLANEETYWCRYIAASTKYNFRIYSKNDGSNNYRLYVEVDHATTNAVCNRLLTQMGYVLLTWTYDGASKLLSMYVNGQAVTTSSGNVGTFTGVGNIITDTAAELYIGRDPSAAPTPVVKGQVLEVMRHQTILSAATILQRFQAMSGVRMADGTYPATATIHNTFGFVPVNTRIWAFTNGWPMMNEKGVLCNVSFGCSMYSTAITDGTGGASNLTITAGVTAAAESGSINSQINGQTLTIPYDGTLQSAMWFNFGLNASVKGAATVVWRGINGAIAYIYIYDETTTKYWVSGTTWSLTPTPIDLSSFIIQGTGTLTDPYISNVPFTTETGYVGFHRIDVFVHNNSQLDATKSLRVYWCQLCDSQQFAAEPLIALHPTGGDSSVMLGTQFQYPASLMNWNVGQINFDFYPVFSSTQPRLSPSNAMTQMSGSTGTNCIQENNGSSAIRFKDNAAHVVSLSPTFNNYELLQIQFNWNNGNGKMTGQIVNKGLSGTTTFTAPLSSGNLFFGTSSQSPGGYISNVVIR